MTAPGLHEAFDSCLTLLLSGKALEECLQQFPELADELRPMLEVARQIEQLSLIPESAQSRSRDRFLAGAAKLRASQSTRASRLPFVLRRATLAMAVVLFFIFSTAGLYYASASTLPGDNLYPAKRAFEAVRLELATSTADRFALEREFAGRRQTELGAVLSSLRATEVDFEGTLVKIGQTQWQVDQFIVQVNSQTQIAGKPQPGQQVSVTAHSQSGILTASRIVAEEIEVTGRLTNTGGQWLINDVAFVIVPETVINGTMKTGAIAVARLRELNTGDRIAVSITLFSTATPTATSSPTVSPTQQVEPTATATPVFTETATSSPTSVVKSPGSPEPDKTLEPSETLEITSPTAPVETQEPGQTLKPSQTSEHLETPEPRETGEHRETPKPEPTEDH